MDDLPFFVKPLNGIFSNFFRIHHSAHEQDLPRLQVVHQEDERSVNVKFVDGLYQAVFPNNSTIFFLLKKKTEKTDKKSACWAS